MSKIQGTFHKITNLSAFAKSYVSNPAQPDPSSFVPFPSVRVTLATDFPGGFSNSFMPAKSITTTADAQGKFTIDVGALSDLPAHGYLIAYRQLTTITVPMTNQKIPIFGPIYRSATFPLNKIAATARDIYLSEQTSPDSSGINQATVNAQVAAAKSQIASSGGQLETLAAFILDGEIHVTGSGRGATIKFDISLSPSTSNDLGQFIKHEMKNFDIDLPGPDFITSLCVNEDKIQSTIASGVAGVVKGFNQTIRTTIIQGIATATGLSTSIVSALFDSQVSLTFEQIRFPVTGHQSLGPLQMTTRSIVADPCFGFPRTLFS